MCALGVGAPIFFFRALTCAFCIYLHLAPGRPVDFYGSLRAIASWEAAKGLQRLPPRIINAKFSRWKEEGCRELYSAAAAPAWCHLERNTNFVAYAQPAALTTSRAWLIDRLCRVRRSPTRRQPPPPPRVDKYFKAPKCAKWEYKSLTPTWDQPEKNWYGN